MLNYVNLQVIGITMSDYDDDRPSKGKKWAKRIGIAAAVGAMSAWTYRDYLNGEISGRNDRSAEVTPDDPPSVPVTTDTDEGETPDGWKKKIKKSKTEQEKQP